MVFSELQSEIKTLSRQEKYRLMQFIVSDLAEEKAPTADKVQAIDSNPKSFVVSNTIQIFLS